MDSLVSTEWLAEEIGSPDLRILDATSFPLDPARDARAGYAAGHLPGAQFMDIITLADGASPLPAMLPSAGAFAARMHALGVDQDSRIVLYDDSPQRTAARGWWMLRTFGAADVAILDGGIAKWIAEGRALASGAETVPAGSFVARKADDAVRSLDQMRANVTSRAEQVLDARSAARFTGDEGDPHGAAPGHIPGSRNLHYARLFAGDGTWKRGAALAAEFAAAGIDLARPIVTTCGSGITAAILLFGAHLLGKPDVAIYDGSWSEWGMLADTEKALGTA